MALTDDLEYLQAPERSDVQRWGWLAGRLDKFEEHQVEDYQRLGEHSKKIVTLEKRCAECNGQIKRSRTLWKAVGAVALAILGSVLGWLKFGK